VKEEILCTQGELGGVNGGNYSSKRGAGVLSGQREAPMRRKEKGTKIGDSEVFGQILGGVESSEKGLGDTLGGGRG